MARHLTTFPTGTDLYTNSEWDEWISTAADIGSSNQLHSSKIDRIGKHTYVSGGVAKLAPGTTVDVSDSRGKWCRGLIVDRVDLNHADGGAARVKIHFVGWDDRWDEWIYDEGVAERIMPAGSKTGFVSSRGPSPSGGMGATAATIASSTMGESYGEGQRRHSYDDAGSWLQRKASVVLMLCSIRCFAPSNHAPTGSLVVLWKGIWDAWKWCSNVCF